MSKPADGPPSSDHDDGSPLLPTSASTSASTHTTTSTEASAMAPTRHAATAEQRAEGEIDATPEATPSKLAHQPTRTPYRARAIPGVILSIWAMRLVLSLIVAYPLASLVKASGITAWPGGDAVLFEPGGLLAIELLRLTGAELFAAARGSLFIWLLAAGISLVLTAWLMAALRNPSRSSSRLRAQQVAQVLPRFLILSILCLLVQLILSVAAVTIGGIAVAAITEDNRRRDLAALALSALLIAALCGIGLIHDLTRAAVIERDARILTAMRLALETFALRPLHAVIGWLIPAAIALAAVVIVALATGALDIRQDAHFWAIAGLHQAAALTLVAARANWLARALRLLECTDPGD